MLFVLLSVSILVGSIIWSSPVFGQSIAGTLILNSGERAVSAVIDPDKGLAYFGITQLSESAVVGGILKIKVPELTRIAILTLNVSQAIPQVALIDATRGFAYFGINSLPGAVIKLDLSTFSIVGTLTLRDVDGRMSSGVIDPKAGFAYFATDSNPSTIVKIRIEDLSLAGALTLDADKGALASAVIDPGSGFAYFGTDTRPSTIVKVRLADFTREASLRLGENEGALLSAVIDTADGFAYFGGTSGNTQEQAGIIVKVRLLDFVQVRTLFLGPDENRLRAAVIDVGRGFAYFGAGFLPSKLLKVRLVDFSRDEAAPLAFGEERIGGALAAVIDPSRGEAYFAIEQTLENPRIVRIRLDVSLTTSTAPAPGFPFDMSSWFVVLVAVAIFSSLLVLSRRRLASATLVRQRLPSYATTGIETGYSDLDRLLGGGLPEGYAFLLLSPPYDERDLLLGRIIESNVSSGRPTALISNELTKTNDLSIKHPQNFQAFCARADMTASDRPNLHKIPGVENLSDLNIAFSKVMASEEKVGGKTIVIDVLSDVLVHHKVLNTRRWLSDFVAKRKAEGYTILATLNPFVAKEDTQTILDLFDGIIEIYEKPFRDRTRRFLVVKKLYGRRYSEAELMLDKEKLY